MSSTILFIDDTKLKTLKEYNIELYYVLFYIFEKINDLNVMVCISKLQNNVELQNKYKKELSDIKIEINEIFEEFQINNKTTDIDLNYLKHNIFPTLY